MRATVAVLIALFVVLLGVGCSTGPVPTGGSDGSATTGDAQLLQEILQAQKSSGADLEGLLKDLRQQSAVQAEANGPSPFQRDLMCAQSLLVAVRRSVNSQDKKGAVLNLRRLEQSVSMMRAEVPAAQIAAGLERAAVALQAAGGYVEADVASVSVLGAMSIALKSPDAALVPNIDLPKQLEEVKGQIDKGEYADALGSIQELIQSVLGHDSLRALANAASGVQGARAALDRDAGYVVVAELDQLSDSFRRLSSMVKASPVAQPAEEKKTEQKPSEAPAAAAEQSKTTPETTTQGQQEQPPSSGIKAPAQSNGAETSIGKAQPAPGTEQPAGGQ